VAVNVFLENLSPAQGHVYGELQALHIVDVAELSSALKLNEIYVARLQAEVGGSVDKQCLVWREGGHERGVQREGESASPTNCCVSQQSNVHFHGIVAYLRFLRQNPCVVNDL
jgi:hypothetical protein